MSTVTTMETSTAPTSPTALRSQADAVVLPDGEIRQKRLANRSTDAATLLALATRGDSVSVRKTVAYNMRTPAEVLVEMLDDPDGRLRYALVKHPNLPLTALVRFADDTNPFCRRAVAWDTRTPEEVRARLAFDPDVEVRKAIAIRATTADVLRSMLNDASAEVRDRLGNRAALLGEDSTTLVQATESGFAARRIARTVPADALEAMRAIAAQDDQWARVNLAQRADCPAEILDLLASDSFLDVRKAVAANDNTSDDTLRRLAVKGRGSLINVISRHTRGDDPLHGLTLLVTHENPKVRAKAALDGEFPCTSEWPDPRPFQMLVALMQDPDPAVRGTAFNRIIGLGRDAAARADVERLVSDPAVAVRARLARFTRSLNTQMTLTGDSSENVRLALAQSEGVSSEALAVLVGDASVTVAEAATQAFMRALR